MGLGAFYSIELLQHRFLGMCSEECLAATSRAHSLSQSANHNRSHRIRCLLLISSIFMYSIFPPFPRIPSEKRETARHQYSLVVFVIFSKKNRKSFGFFAWVSGESRDIAQVLAKKQVPTVPTVPTDQQRSIPGETRPQLARMELRQCLPP